MDRDTYRRWRDHPLRELLRRAETVHGGYLDTIRPDEIDDLNLPPRVRAATEQAIERIRTASPTDRGYGGLTDHIGPALMGALPADWETKQQHRERRASLGDPQAIRDSQAIRGNDATMADDILGGRP